MAKMKANNTGLWLISGGEKDGVQLGAVLKDARWVEITVYDYDAPPNRRFTVMYLDRSTGAVVSATERHHTDAVQKTQQAASVVI